LSDAKKHDRFAMQHYSEEELPWLEKYMREEFPDDIPNKYITHLHQHSDNAAQHFKSTGALEFFTSLINKDRDPKLCKYVYSFGAPGHGKGCFDGVGGTFKNKIHQLIKSTKTSMEGIPGVDSGYIGSVDEVFQALKHSFTVEADQSRKKARKNPIHHYKFFLHKSPDIRRPQTETFVGLENITKNYQFVVTNIGIVHKRNRSCWCMKCMKAMMKGSLEWQQSQRVSGCTSSKHSASVYEFIKTSCTKTAGVGVTTARTERVHDKSDMASKLTQGDWMFFKGGKDGCSQLVWLGRAVGKTEWLDQCIWKNNTTRTVFADGVPVAPNEYAINVQWYTLKQAGSTLEYVIEQSEPEPLVNNNNELLHAGFPMTQVIGSTTTSARVPRRRNVRSSQSDEYEYDTPASLQTSEGYWFRKECANVWALAQDDKDLAHSRVNNI